MVTWGARLSATALRVEVITRKANRQYLAAFGSRGTTFGRVVVVSPREETKHSCHSCAVAGLSASPTVLTLANLRDSSHAIRRNVGWRVSFQRLEHHFN